MARRPRPPSDPRDAARDAPGPADDADGGGSDGGGSEAEPWAGTDTPDELPRAERPSRSQRKREALALQRLGVALTRLRATQLAALALPEDLREAVLEAQRLRSRAALARQRQYIGRLMRQIDAAPIERALQALDAKLIG